MTNVLWRSPSGFGLAELTQTRNVVVVPFDFGRLNSSRHPGDVGISKRQMAKAIRIT